MKGIYKLLICASLLAFTFSVSTAHEKGWPLEKMEKKCVTDVTVFTNDCIVYDYHCTAENVAVYHAESICMPAEKVKEIKATRIVTPLFYSENWKKRYYLNSQKLTRKNINRSKIVGIRRGMIGWRL